jgi:hypothetical protein
MAKYFVMVREVHVSMREIEAKSPGEALGMVANGDGTEVHCEWSHALPPDTWSVEDDHGNLMFDGNLTVCDITG